MRERTESLLNDMMVSYDRAVAKPPPGPTDEEAAQQTFGHLCEEVIRPLMTTFGEVLEAHGHRCRVYRKSLSVMTPGQSSQNPEIVMCVLPKKAPATTHGYEISVALVLEQRKILTRTKHGRWAESCSACPHNLHPLDGVTPELIEAELLEMIQHVLAENLRA